LKILLLNIKITNMQVVLLKDLENLGKKGEVKKVADGYGRNFLIPKQIAVLATKSEISKIKEQERIDAGKAEKELGLFQKIASQIDGLEIEIPVKTNKEGGLFGTVGAGQIAGKLKENISFIEGLPENFEIKKEQIKIDAPIKELGEYETTVEFPHNLEAKIKIIVIEEAEPARKEIKEE
jgi:large subunit ribosomal protein L9